MIDCSLACGNYMYFKKDPCISCLDHNLESQTLHPPTLSSFTLAHIALIFYHPIISECPLKL